MLQDLHQEKKKNQWQLLNVHAAWGGENSENKQEAEKKKKN